MLGGALAACMRACIKICPPRGCSKKRKGLRLPGHPSRCRAARLRTTQFRRVHSGVRLGLIYHPQPILADLPFSLNSRAAEPEQRSIAQPAQRVRALPQSLGSSTLQRLWNRTCSHALICLYLILVQNFISYHSISSGKGLLISILPHPPSTKIIEVAECF